MTLVLQHAEVARSLDALSLLEIFKRVFQTAGSGGARHVPSLLEAGGGSFELGVGLLADIPAYSVRIDTQVSTPGAGLTRTLHLHDRTSGSLLAILDAQHLCAIRTGVVGALAADVLARKDSSRVALIGAGPQSAVQLKCLRLVRTLEHVRVFDVNPVRAMQLAERLYREVQLPVRVEDSVEAAVRDADLVVTATDFTEPFLFPGMLRPGTHVTVLGRGGVSSAVLAQCRVLVDDTPALGEVLGGRSAGRGTDAEVTVFIHTGVAFTELAAAWHVYESLRDDADVVRVTLGRVV